VSELDVLGGEHVAQVRGRDFRLDEISDLVEAEA